MPNESGTGRGGAHSTELVALIARCHSRWLAVAARVLHDREEARDAVQDAYLQAVRQLHRFDGRARLSTWLHRIVVNAALMRLRTRRRHPAEPLDPSRLAADTAGPESLVHARQMQVLVRRSLARVRPAERQVLLLRDVAGHDADEVARTLRVTRGALKVRAYRARRALRVRLAEAGVTTTTKEAS